MEKDIEDLKKLYDIDFEKIIDAVTGKNIVLLQFPDGLKPYATSVVDYLESKVADVTFLIYFGNCYGACDTPTDLDGKVDLIIQIGHNSMMPDYLRD